MISAFYCSHKTVNKNYIISHANTINMFYSYREYYVNVLSGYSRHPILDLENGIMILDLEKSHDLSLKNPTKKYSSQTVENHEVFRVVS